MNEGLLRGWRELPSLPRISCRRGAGGVQRANAAAFAGVRRHEISPRPLFLIYAGRGGGGEDLTPQFYAAAHAPKGIWKINESGHVGGLVARPHEYERRVVSFFDRSLLDDSHG